MEHIKDLYIKRNEKNVVWAKLNESIIMVAMKDDEEKVFKLNRTAAYIWEQCDGSKTVHDLVMEVCSQFKVDEQQALNDTMVFVKNMSRKQLIITSPTQL